jgi:DNA-binding NarL/FixJ family response regulator
LITVADDYETVRRGVCAILESRRDIEVCAQAANGEEAVRKAKELRPDIIIMDFTMPVMDGIEASKQILHLFPEMPIIMFSMHNLETLATAAKDLGLRGFITKGGSADNLLAAIDKVVNKESFFVLTA